RRSATHRDGGFVRDLPDPHQHAAGRAQRRPPAVGSGAVVPHERTAALDRRDHPVGHSLRPGGRPSRDRARSHRHDRRRVLHRSRRAGLSDHRVRERFPDRSNVRASDRRRDHGHLDDGSGPVVGGSYRTVAEERAMRGSSQMRARAFWAIGLGFAMLITACGGGGGGLDEGHLDDGAGAVVGGWYRTVAEERAMGGSSQMRARAFWAIGLGFAMLITACGGGGGGTGGTATASTAPTAAAATAAPKATCAAKKITIAVPVTPPNVVHLTPYVADAFGYFKDENLTVELVRFDGGVGSLRASASGAIDLAGTSSEPVVDAIANGADVKIIYTYAPLVDV